MITAITTCRNKLFSLMSLIVLIQSNYLTQAVPSQLALFRNPHHPHVSLMRPQGIIVADTHHQSILSIRGGADHDTDDDDNDDANEDNDDDSDVDLALDESYFDITEDDFQEDHTVGRMVEAWHKTPPLTKLYLSASVTATLWGYLSHPNHEFPAILQLDWTKTLTRLQLWRPLTAFLNVGNFGLGYLMTAHFLWTYMSTLERLNHDAPYDFWIMILFGMLSMVTGYGFFRLSPKFLGHNLSTFLVYVWSRYHEGLEVNMFELFNTRAELLPWFFLAQTFLLEGEVPLLDFLGIVFGHVYHHCKTVGILTAPDALIQWYNSNTGSGAAIRSKYKQISADFEMQA
jgi:Derlin-2/3